MPICLLATGGDARRGGAPAARLGRPGRRFARLDSAVLDVLFWRHSGTIPKSLAMPISRDEAEPPVWRESSIPEACAEAARGKRLAIRKFERRPRGPAEPQASP